MFMRLSCKRRHARVTVGSNSVMCDAYCRSEMQGSATLLRIQGGVCHQEARSRRKKIPHQKYVGIFKKKWQNSTRPSFIMCLFEKNQRGILLQFCVLLTVDNQRAAGHEKVNV